MANFHSDLSKEELTMRWDNITSPARFAGADDMTDCVFISTRKDDRVTLVKKPKISFDPLSAYFRGKISADGDGSKITGIYTKGLTDYIVGAAISLIYFGVAAEYASRAENPSMPLAFIVGGIIVLILLYITYPGTRKKYEALIKEVTEGAVKVDYNGSIAAASTTSVSALSSPQDEPVKQPAADTAPKKTVNDEKNPPPEEPAEEKREKYKFRF